MIRTQIFLTKDEVNLIAAEARRKNSTKSEIVRQALDEYLGLKKMNKKQLLEAFDRSVGICKGMGLKRKLQQLRSRW